MRKGLLRIFFSCKNSWNLKSTPGNTSAKQEACMYLVFLSKQSWPGHCLGESIQWCQSTISNSVFWDGVLNTVEHQWDTSVSQLRNRFLVNYHLPENFYRLPINLVMNVASVYLWLCRTKILLQMKHLSYKNRLSWSMT